MCLCHVQWSHVKNTLASKQQSECQLHILSSLIQNGNYRVNFFFVPMSCVVKPCEKHIGFKVAISVLTPYFIPPSSHSAHCALKLTGTIMHPISTCLVWYITQRICACSARSICLLYKIMQCDHCTFFFFFFEWEMYL